MSGVPPPPIDLHVSELINSFAAIGELARAAIGPSDRYDFDAWMSEIELALIGGFIRAIPSLDNDGQQIIRRIIRGEILSPGDRANLTYSLVDATQVSQHTTKWVY